MMRRVVVAAVMSIGLLVHVAPAGAVVEARSVPTYLAGQFCKKTDVGKSVMADNGKMIKCVPDGSRHRWVVK